MLLEYVKSHTIRDPREYGREKTISLASLSGSSDLENLSDIGLLTQAGYLTIKAVEYGNTVFLDYPNLEVKRAMAQLYTELLLKGKVAGQVGAGNMSRSSEMEILRKYFIRSIGFLPQLIIKTIQLQMRLLCELSSKFI